MGGSIYAGVFILEGDGYGRIEPRQMETSRNRRGAQEKRSTGSLLQEGYM